MPRAPARAIGVPKGKINMPNTHDRTRRFVMIDQNIFSKPKGKKLIRMMEEVGWCRLKTVGAFVQLVVTVEAAHLRGFDSLLDVMDATDLPLEFFEALIEIKWIRYQPPAPSVIADRKACDHPNPLEKQLVVRVWKDSKATADLDPSRPVPDKKRQDKKRRKKGPLEIDRSKESISSEEGNWTSDQLPSDGKSVKEHLDGKSIREAVDELKRQAEAQKGDDASE